MISVRKGILVNGTKRAGAINNAGYTLLEMIVVVAILAVGLTIVGMSINTIFSLELRQCAKQIHSELGKEKVAAMTRSGDVYMRLYKTDEGVYIDKYENDKLIEKEIEVGSVKMTVTYYIGSDATGTQLDADGIIIAFNKSNGSFKKAGQARALFDSAYIPNPSTDAYYSKFVIQSGGSSRTIVLWPDTGKFSISG
jgi:prepilin-type N-terminal cleavage/methylation domain-containing protein